MADRQGRWPVQEELGLVEGLPPSPEGGGGRDVSPARGMSAQGAGGAADGTFQDGPEPAGGSGRNGIPGTGELSKGRRCGSGGDSGKSQGGRCVVGRVLWGEAWLAENKGLGCLSGERSVPPRAGL